MIYLNRVAREIKGVGFYDSLLQDVKERLKKDEIEVWEIEELLKSDESLLKEYKELNLEYNLSNIHIKEISLSGLKDECKRDAKIFNKNLKKLKELEKYTLDFSRSSFLVLLFSVEFFVLFSVQYFIVLLSLKEYQLLIYGLFLSSVFVAWWYAKREKKKYEENSKRFYEIYEDSLNILFTLEKNGCIKRDELYIKESIEHI
jgi:hypothetical protein